MLMKKSDLGDVHSTIGEIHTEDMEIRHVLEKQFVQPLIGTIPSVLNRKIFELTNTAPLTITDFADGALGQRIYILGDGFTTIANNTTIKTNTGANKLLAVNKVYTFTFFGVTNTHKWVEDVDEVGSGGGSIIADQKIKNNADISVNNVAYTALDTALDITLAAVAGDKILISANGFWRNDSADLSSLDVITLVGGAAVNYVSGMGAAGTGVQSWRAFTASVNIPISGLMLYTVVAGDISGGNIVLRIVGKMVGVVRSIGALGSSNRQFVFSAINLRQ